MRRFVCVISLVSLIACTQSPAETSSSVELSTPSPTATTEVADLLSVFAATTAAMSRVQSLEMEFSDQLFFKDGAELLTEGSGAVDLARRRGMMRIDVPNIPGDSK